MIFLIWLACGALTGFVWQSKGGSFAAACLWGVLLGFFALIGACIMTPAAKKIV